MATYFAVLFGVIIKYALWDLKIPSVYIPWELGKDTDNLFALLVLLISFIAKCNTAVLRDIFQAIIHFTGCGCSR